MPEDFKPSKHEWGTDEGRKWAEDMTPGQKVDQIIKEAQNGQSDYTAKTFSKIIGNPLQGYPHNEEFTVEGSEVEESRYTDERDKRQKATLKKHDKRMIKISRDSIKKYEKGRKEETEVEEDRDYKKEYENYHSDPEQIKRRAKRNEARRSLKNSKKLTSDKDVHHKDNNPMNNDKSNLSIVTQNYNRKEPRMRDKLKEKGCLPNAKRK